MFTNVSEFVFGEAHKEKKQYRLYSDGDTVCVGDFEVVMAEASKSSGQLRITKEIYFAGTWLPIAHYFPDTQVTELHKLKEKMENLDAEINKLSKEIAGRKCE